jgi:hypothetical protein
MVFIVWEAEFDIYGSLTSVARDQVRILSSSPGTVSNAAYSAEELPSAMGGR